MGGYGRGKSFLQNTTPNHISIMQNSQEVERTKTWDQIYKFVNYIKLRKKEILKDGLEEVLEDEIKDLELWGSMIDHPDNFQTSELKTQLRHLHEYSRKHHIPNAFEILRTQESDQLQNSSALRTDFSLRPPPTPPPHPSSQYQNSPDIEIIDQITPNIPNTNSEITNRTNFGQIPELYRVKLPKTSPSSTSSIHAPGAGAETINSPHSPVILDYNHGTDDIVILDYNHRDQTPKPVQVHHHRRESNSNRRMSQGQEQPSTSRNCDTFDSNKPGESRSRSKSRESSQSSGYSRRSRRSRSRSEERDSYRGKRSGRSKEKDRRGGSYKNRRLSRSTSSSSNDEGKYRSRHNSRSREHFSERRSDSRRRSRTKSRSSDRRNYRSDRMEHRASMLKENDQVDNYSRNEGGLPGQSRRNSQDQAQFGKSSGPKEFTQDVLTTALLLVKKLCDPQNSNSQLAKTLSSCLGSQPSVNLGTLGGSISQTTITSGPPSVNTNQTPSTGHRQVSHTVNYVPNSVPVQHQPPIPSNMDVNLQPFLQQSQSQNQPPFLPYGAANPFQYQQPQNPRFQQPQNIPQNPRFQQPQNIPQNPQFQQPQNTPRNPQFPQNIPQNPQLQQPQNNPQYEQFQQPGFDPSYWQSHQFPQMTMNSPIHGPPHFSNLGPNPFNTAAGHNPRMNMSGRGASLPISQSPANQTPLRHTNWNGNQQHLHNNFPRNMIRAPASATYTPASASCNTNTAISNSNHQTNLPISSQYQNSSVGSHTPHSSNISPSQNPSTRLPSQTIHPEIQNVPRPPPPTTYGEHRMRTGQIPKTAMNQNLHPRDPRRPPQRPHMMQNNLNRSNSVNTLPSESQSTGISDKSIPTTTSNTSSSSTLANAPINLTDLLDKRPCKPGKQMTPKPKPPVAECHPEPQPPINSRPIGSAQTHPASTPDEQPKSNRSGLASKIRNSNEITNPQPPTSIPSALKIRRPSAPQLSPRSSSSTVRTSNPSTAANSTENRKERQRILHNVKEKCRNDPTPKAKSKLKQLKDECKKSGIGVSPPKRKNSTNNQNKNEINESDTRRTLEMVTTFTRRQMAVKSSSKRLAVSCRPTAVPRPVRILSPEAYTSQSGPTSSRSPETKTTSRASLSVRKKKAKRILPLPDSSSEDSDEEEEIGVRKKPKKIPPLPDSSSEDEPPIKLIPENKRFCTDGYIHPVDTKHLTVLLHELPAFYSTNKDFSFAHHWEKQFDLYCKHRLRKIRRTSRKKKAYSEAELLKMRSEKNKRQVKDSQNSEIPKSQLNESYESSSNNNFNNFEISASDIENGATVATAQTNNYLSNNNGANVSGPIASTSESARINTRSTTSNIEDIKNLALEYQESISKMKVIRIKQEELDPEIPNNCTKY